MYSVTVIDVATALFFKGILDDAAQSGELNLVQVSSIDLSGKSIVAPLVYLTSGAHYQTRLDVVLPDAMVVFNLAKGSGPIHLLGLHTVAVPSEDLDLSEAEEEEAGDADTDNEIEMKETEAEGEVISRDFHNAFQSQFGFE